MRVTARDRAVLTAFGILIVCAAGYGIHSQIAPNRGAGSSVAYATGLPAAKSTSVSPSVPVGQSAVLARHMFRPRISTRPTRDFLGGSTASETPVASHQQSEPIAEVTRAGWRSAPSEDEGGDGEGEGDDEDQGEPISIALTGVYSRGDTVYAIVENAEKETLQVALGDDAFGYTLSYVSQEGAVFQADGRAYVLKVGDGKSARAAEAKPQTEEAKPEDPPSGGGPPGGGFGGGMSMGGPPGGGGGFDWGSMSPEDRARMAERFRGRGGDGGGGGGGGDWGGRGGRGGGMSFGRGRGR